MHPEPPFDVSKIAVGFVSKTMGREGGCWVTVFGSTLKHIVPPVKVFIGVSEADCREITIDRVEFKPKGPLCFFKDVTDSDKAEKLRGLYIFVDRDILPDLAEGNFYQFQLIGMKVISEGAGEIGWVCAVYNFPTIDSIEVNRPNGEKVMLPLSAEAIEEVDIKEGVIKAHYRFIEEML